MKNPDKKGFVTKAEIVDLSQLISDVHENENFHEAGDLITFSGVVRASSSVSDKKVSKIEIQAYEEMANQQLNEICHELIDRYQLVDARLVHFVGIFEIGEYLVHCVIASRHRKEGLIALKEMIEAYKKRAYLFKCEIYEDGTEKWVSTEKPDT